MGLRKYRPITPAYVTSSADFKKSRQTGLKSLIWVVSTKSSGGRNNSGKWLCATLVAVTKKFFRITDFKRNDKDLNWRNHAKTIEYDPNRSFALHGVLQRRWKALSSLPGIKGGTKLCRVRAFAPEVGNTLFLSEIPLGNHPHNIEFTSVKVQFW